MKVIQVIDSFSMGRGVGNCLWSMAEVLDGLNVENEIWARQADGKYVGGKVYLFRNVNEILLKPKDIIFYHFYLGMPLNEEIRKWPQKKVLIYHNVTPPRYFRDICLEKFKECLWGLYDAEWTVGCYLKAIVPSRFSRSDLLRLGWNKEDVAVIPLVKAGLPDITPSEKIMEKYCGGYVNFLYTGRIAGNKKVEDIIRIFAYYQEKINCKSRLILAGNIGYRNYYLALEDYVKYRKIKDVIFTGRISQEELEAYYAVADIYVSMSEHEGFGLPLIEAMQRKIPIVAYNTAAVSDTLGDAGVLVDTKDEKVVCKWIDRLVQDRAYREGVIRAQEERARVYSLENYKEQLLQIIQKINMTEVYSYKMEKEWLELEDESVCGIQKSMEDIRKGLSIKRGKAFVWIVYGMGVNGKKLTDQMEACGWKDELLFCDNGLSGTRYRGKCILNHQECINKYRNAVYIITVRNAVIAITAGLLEQGIPKERIRFYDGDMIY